MLTTRREFLAYCAAAVATAAVLPVGGTARAAGGHAATAPVGPAEAVTAGGRPNIVLIITDDQDATSLEVMRKLNAHPGDGWTQFNNAVCNDGICAPSRATVLTGQYSHHHGVERNGWTAKLDEAHALPVWLAGAGYRCALFGKYSFGKKDHSWPKPPGWDIFDSGGGYADTVFQKGVDYIRHAGSDPFFLMVTPVDPHIKAKPPARYKDAAVTMSPLPPNINEADVSDKPARIRSTPLMRLGKLKSLAKERANAYRAILAVDDGVQAIVDELAAVGKLDNTAIIFMSDHGFSWGSHRLERKHLPYEEVIRIPLVIRRPGQVGNRVENRVVSTVDLAPTIAALAGVTPMIAADGYSLLPMMDGEPGWVNGKLIEKHADTRDPGSFYGVRTGLYTYVEHDTGEVELYDLTADPYQMNSVHNDPGYSGVRATLAGLLTSMKD